MKFNSIVKTDAGIRTVAISDNSVNIGHLSHDPEAGDTWALTYEGRAHDTRAKTVKEAKEWAKGFIIDMQTAKQDVELPEGSTVNEETGEITLPEYFIPEGADGDDGSDKDETAPRSVVKAHYQRIYKEASTSGRSCGDWLAEELDGAFMAGGPKKKDMYFDYDAFESFLTMNGVKLGHWAAV